MNLQNTDKISGEIQNNSESKANFIHQLSMLIRILKGKDFFTYLTLFPMGYFPTDFPWQVVAASPAYANDFLNFWKFHYEIC